MKSTTLSIQGMTCGHCVKSVSSALRAIDGVEVKKVTIGSAEVSYDEAKVEPEALFCAIEEEGFEVSR